MVVRLVELVRPPPLGRVGKTVSTWLPAMAGLYDGSNVPVADWARKPLLWARLKSARNPPALMSIWLKSRARSNLVPWLPTYLASTMNPLKSCSTEIFHCETYGDRRLGSAIPKLVVGL